MTSRSRRRLIVTLFAVTLAALGTLTCSPGYVIRAGIEESRILSRRRAIADVVADSSTAPGVRAQLGLVEQSRDYAVRVLHLKAGDSYTTYSWVDHDTLLLVVSAAYKDRFQPYTWWFPIVGRVPYKGFFDFDAAYRTAAQLDRRGFDTYVRPSSAFSTLGFFNDPVLNTALRTDDVGIASTVIHELLHNTLFIPSQVAFNESLASFVGDRGAVGFFCARDGDDAETCHHAQNEWEDDLTFGAFLSDLVDNLERLYARTDIDSTAKIAQRERVFADAKQHFQADVEPRLHASYRGFTQRPLNNATLIGIRLYYRRLDLFEQVFEHEGRDLVASILAIQKATGEHQGDPYAAVERILAAPPEPRPPAPD